MICFDNPSSIKYLLVRSRIYCLARFVGFILCLPKAFSSPIVFADRSADYWKRQLTLEETENIVCWASSLNCRGCCLCAFAIRLILLGKGWVYRMEWHWACRSFLVEHPQQHFYKLRKPYSVIFFLLSNVQLIQISEAGTRKHFSISNLAHSFDCKTYGESLQQPDLHHRVGFLSIPPLSLDNGLEQLKLLILFLFFCLAEALIFFSGQTKQKGLQIRWFPAKLKLAWSFSEKIHRCGENRKQLKFLLEVEFLLFASK